jgi:hypothetical protein
MTTVPIAKEFLGLVRAGKKTSTIRRGIRTWAIGPVILTSGDEQVVVKVTRVSHKMFGSLTEEDARRDGFDSLCDLGSALKRFYPTINSEIPVTILSFKVI